jgi:hypothetical protein
MFEKKDFQADLAGGYLEVGLQHAFNWVVGRIKEMMEKDKQMVLTKLGSWNMSDEWLSDILCLYSLGAFR